MAKIPPRGFTGKCMQPQRRNDTTNEWINNGFPVTVYNAEMTIQNNQQEYLGSYRTKRFCYLIPAKVEMNVSFTLDEEYK